MPLRQCAVVRHGERVGVYPTARVARSADQVGTWVPHEPFVVVEAADYAALAAAVRAALAASIDEPPLRKAPIVKEAYARFVAALGLPSVAAMMREAWVGNVLDDAKALRFLVMRRTAGGFGVDPDAHFDLPLDAGDDALAAAVMRQLAGT